MEEQKITLETLNLAREKGFSKWVHPTQSLLQKWLRDKLGSHIIIEPAGIDFDLFVGYYCKTPQDVIEREMQIINTKYKDIKMYPSYEVCLENILFESLKSL